MSTSLSDAARTNLLRAIQIEARNGRIYNSLAQLFQGYDVAITGIFREMAAEELQHGAELERHYFERFGPVPSPLGEAKEVIEAPDLDDAEALIFDSMTIEQALQVGLRAEETAREFYRCEMTRTSDPELQAAYRELAEFEEAHVQLLKRKLEESRRAHNSSR